MWLICTDSPAAEEQENSTSRTSAVEESNILPEEIITQSTETKTPFGSTRIFGELGPGKTQANFGEKMATIITQEVPNISSHVTTLAAITWQQATELTSGPYFEDSKEQSLITKDTSGTKGKSFKFAANSETLYKSIRFKDLKVRQPTKTELSVISHCMHFQRRFL